MCLSDLFLTYINVCQWILTPGTGHGKNILAGMVQARQVIKYPTFFVISSCSGIGRIIK